MSTDNEHGLSPQDKELVALGASVGAGCHPCVDYHLEAAKKADLAGSRVRIAITSGQRVATQAAEELARHVQGQLDVQDPAPAAPAPLDRELSGLGAAIGANDRTAIERHMRAAAALGVSPSQLHQAVEVAHTVQTNAAAIHFRAAQRLVEDMVPPETPAPGGSPGDESSCGCDGTAGPAANPERNAGVER